MTLIVCPNLAVDRVVELERLVPGDELRAACVAHQAGGKGANVARALAALGSRSLLLGYAAGHTGRLIAQLADDEGLEVELVVLGGEARICTVFLERDGRRTAVYEHGPQLARADERTLTETVRGVGASGAWAVLTGSAPPGATPGFYASLVAALHEARFKVLLDAAEEQLAGALAQRPALVKVNLTEAAGVTGVVGRDLGAAETAARALRAAGAQAAVVTLGSDGAVASVGDELLHVSAPPVDLVNSVGSGDCFAAGVLFGMERGLSLPAALPLAAGAGAANAATQATAQLDAGLARRLAAEVALSSRAD